LISIVVTTVLYILVAVSRSALIGWKELSLSKAPLPLAAEKSFGILSFCTLIALFATSNTPLVLISQVTIVFCDHYYCYCNFGYLLIAEMQLFPYQKISIYSILSVNISAVYC
jgi:amino acid transporter